MPKTESGSDALCDLRQVTSLFYALESSSVKCGITVPTLIRVVLRIE